MIFFSIGLPSPLVEWCDALIAGLMQAVGAPAEVVSANTLEELGLALIKTEASHFVVASRLPNDGLRSALTENNKRFVVALDDPRAAFRNLIQKHGYDCIAAARAVAGSCVSLLNYAAMRGGLVLRAEQEGREPVRTAGAIARHLALSIESAEIARVVDELAQTGVTPEPSDLDARWDGIEASEQEIVNGALDGYIDHFAGRGLGKISWARDLFVVGDDPRQPANQPIDITGRTRNLLFGPYMPLPPGTWTAAVVLGFSKEAAEMSYGLEFVAGSRCVSLSRSTIEPHGDRVFEATVSFIVDEATDQPISLRINNERAAFEGRLVLGSVTLTPQENRHPEIPHELQTALDQ
jgi:ParB-like chromosome segregation protein Spo0J